LFCDKKMREVREAEGRSVLRQHAPIISYILRINLFSHEN
jgi:hypothetical protein